MLRRVGTWLAQAGIFVVGAILFLGELYWLYMALKLGSFLMFVLGLLGPAILITAPVGTYMMLYEVPQWVHHTFG